MYEKFGASCSSNHYLESSDVMTIKCTGGSYVCPAGDESDFYESSRPDFHFDKFTVQID